MCHLPTEIDDTETIVRIILSPYHIKKDKKSLTPQAFRPKHGTDDVSVVRQSHMGSEFCKKKGLELQKSPQPIYSGLAVIKASAIKSCGSEIHDSREVYCGHAHISHGIVLEPNEPLAAEKNMMITDRCKALIALTTYHPDPSPASPDWTGPAL
jgi:hypothetical protein